MSGINAFFRLFAFSLVLGIASSLTAADPDAFVWIEAESPTAFSGLPELKSWEHPYFSNKWLHVSVDADKLDTITGDAVFLSYDFAATTAGKHELWNRIGFEYVRSPFEWRIDKNEWRIAKPDDLTIDLMEVGFWCEIAWLKLGEVELTAGKHTLEIRIPKGKKQDGKPDRILYASDCLCLYPGRFEPYSKFKPNEDHRAEKAIRIQFDLEKIEKLGLTLERVLTVLQEQQVAWKHDGPKEKRGEYTVRSLGRLSSLDDLSNTIILANSGSSPEIVRLSAIASIAEESAAADVFVFEPTQAEQLLAKTVTTRNEIPLAGVWEVCRDDELLPEPVVQPISHLPNTTRWSTIAVPGDKNTLRPDLMFAHRVWYRTKVDIPKLYEGKAFFLEFPQNNLNTTVYVNGKLCGFEKSPFVKFSIDISQAMRPGINEIYVGIRDAWYGRTEKADDPMKLRKTFNLPKKFFGDGFQDLVYPIWNHPQSGILITPKLVKTGSVYISDVFVQTSVAKKEIAFDITVRNTTSRNVEQQIVLTAFDGNDPDSKDRKHFSSNQKFVDGAVAGRSLSDDRLKIALGPSEEKTVRYAASWSDPVLWTPNHPHLYTLEAMVLDIQTPQPTDSVAVAQSSGPIDTLSMPFGFREWSIHGTEFLLNGVPYHAWADCFEQPTKEEWLDFYRKTHQHEMRFWGTQWKGLPPEEALAFFDQHGVIVRRSGIFDGQAIGQNVIENDASIRALNKAADPTKERVKMDLYRNWRDQMAAQVKAERNHPSIMLWSMENEVLYINCINLYGDLMNAFEDEVAKTSAALQAVDPTRSSMVDGGGATQSNRLAVHGDHYIVDDFTKYPDLAYTPHVTGGGRGRWSWDQQRPRFVGEDFYVNGYAPADFAVIGGEEAFQGRTGARRAVGLMYRMLTEGYRWSGYGGWQFWADQHRGTPDQYVAFSPLAVFCKEWDWTFPSHGTVRRTMRIFNDTQRDEKIRFKFQWLDSQQQLQDAAEKFSRSGEKTFDVSAGKSIEFPLTLTTPQYLSRNSKGGTGRVELTLAFTLETQSPGETAWTECFRDEKNVSILAPGFGLLAAGSAPPSNVPAGAQVAPSTFGTFSLLLYDPKSSLTEWLQQEHFIFQTITDLNVIPKGEYGNTILLIGNNAITSEMSKSAALSSFAAQGNRVIVLEQTNPLCAGALPCAMETATNEGRTAFIENEAHPVFADLNHKDFFTWAGGHIVYRNAYKKPTRGARSLLQCDKRLESSALVEVPVGTGVMLLTQACIGEKLGQSVVARQLLGNMLRYAVEYKLEYTPVVVCTEGLNPHLLKELGGMRLKYESAKTVNEALGDDRRRSKAIIVLAATPENLKQLVRNAATLKSFYALGGTILLHGLTPDGLGDFNQLVGFDHMIREFRRERVAFPPKRHPLMQGLTLADVAMSSGEKIFGWANDEFVASDTFSYVVDYEDVAPFAAYRNDFERMMSNGMLSADAWKYIVNVPAPDMPPLDFTLVFPKEQEIIETTWTGNTFYSPVTKIGLFFDGKPETGFFTDVEPNTEPQTFAVQPAVRGTALTLRLADWTKVPGKEKTTGLDNIELKAKRSSEFYEHVKPLLNIGALMYYPKSEKGGLVLCNVKFQEKEAVPVNATKKRNTLATILSNLDAEFIVK